MQIVTENFFLIPHPFLLVTPCANPYASPAQPPTRRKSLRKPYAKPYAPPYAKSGRVFLCIYGMLRFPPFTDL